jgi:hypothetical protein
MGFRPWNQGEESWFEWCMECAEYHVERSTANQAMMTEHHNPNVQSPSDFQYYVARHGVSSNYHERTHEQLIGDVNVLHDFTRKLVKEKNQMQQALSKAERKVDMANLKIWILCIFLAAEGSIIGWLIHEFLIHEFIR